MVVIAGDVFPPPAKYPATDPGKYVAVIGTISSATMVSPEANAASSSLSAVLTSLTHLSSTFLP